jgi:hypothetical protein
MEGRDQLKEFIDLLTEAHRLGFKSLLSPIVPELDLMTDLCLRINLQLREGLGKRVVNNSILKAKRGEVDESNNEKILKIRSSSSFEPPDPEGLALFFMRLATQLQHLKANPRMIPFMGDRAAKASVHHYWRRQKSKRL